MKDGHQEDTLKVGEGISSQDSTKSNQEKTMKHDAVNPAHYKAGGIELIDVIDQFKLDYARGSVLKYVVRAGKKDPTKELEDLKKARWFLNHAIELLEREG